MTGVSGCSRHALTAAAMVIYLSGTILTASQPGHHVTSQLGSEHPMPRGASPTFARLPADPRAPGLVAAIPQARSSDSSLSGLCEGCKDMPPNPGSKAVPAEETSPHSDSQPESPPRPSPDRKDSQGSQPFQIAPDAQLPKTPDSTQKHVSLLNALLAVNGYAKSSGVDSKQKLSERVKRSKRSMTRSGHSKDELSHAASSSIAVELQDSSTASVGGSSQGGVTGKSGESVFPTKNQSNSGDERGNGTKDTQKARSAPLKNKQSSGSAPQLIHSIWPDGPVLNISTFLKMQKEMRLRLEVRRSGHVAFSALSCLLVLMVVLFYALGGWKRQTQQGNPHDALEDPQKMFVNDLVRSRSRYLPMFRNTAVVDMIMVQDRGSDP